MSEQVTLTIDGKEISVPKGQTIIQAAQAIGTEIPHFCWHPGLSVAGVCRFCMVKVEGVPKLQIACNTAATQGMKVVTVSEEVKDAHKWALEFHLINHPLDCPICDQAGECGLQNYYMKVGKYQSQMEERKVLKPKALDIGDTLVLDTERCILCSRCVRFEDEVTKTSSLGIFNRGDHAIIGTFPNRRVTHNYSYNLADICPVGAFTAKDFRFKCRVWFLSETKTICPGCSTGCNVNLFSNKNQRQYYRLKPRFNQEVNGHWMCDYGRTMYEHLNAENRISSPYVNGNSVSWQDAFGEIANAIKTQKTAGRIQQTVSLVLTPQYTNEEYEVILNGLKELLGELPPVYIWRSAQESLEDFDGILFRGDKNANSYGLNKVLQKLGVTGKTLSADFSLLAVQNPELVFVFAPEVYKSYFEIEKDISRFSEITKTIYFSASSHPDLSKFSVVIPNKVFAEKYGTYMNFKGIGQNLKANAPVFKALKNIDEIFAGISHQ
ncbi:MAG: (2Fe-2S)-binding protein [Silvanigrellaceae bacterium]|nr:(2Fe-2S)-binding protein [Silvanigrellaceae bacterium]